jgi:hypothetical protein
MQWPGDERRAAVDHDDLAVVALVDDADVRERPGMEERERAAALAQPALRVAAHLLAAGRIDQHAHFHACLRAIAERLRDTPAQLAILPEKRLEMHRTLRRGDVFEQHVEEGAVLDDLHVIAGDRRAQREPGERTDQLFQRTLRFDPEVRFAVAGDRPDDEEQQEDDRDQQHDHGARDFHGHVREVRESALNAFHRRGWFQRKRHALHSIGTQRRVDGRPAPGASPGGRSRGPALRLRFRSNPAAYRL